MYLITLNVEATFVNNPNEKSYAFDGGKTWQEESSKTYKTNGKVLIVVRDENELLSTIYTEEISKVDVEGPILTVTKTTGKLVALTIKDSESGIVGWIVTKSTSVPKNWTKIDLTKDVVIKYNASSNGTYYAWAKDSLGNTTYKKFVVGSSNASNNTTSKETISITGVSG